MTLPVVWVKGFGRLWMRPENIKWNPKALDLIWWCIQNKNYMFIHIRLPTNDQESNYEDLSKDICSIGKKMEKQINLII